MIKLSHCCTFFLFFLLAGICRLPAHAATEPYEHSLRGVIKQGDTLVVKDEKFGNPAYNWSLITNRSVDNIITFGLYRDQQALPALAFKCKVNLKIEYWSQPDQADPITIDQVELEIGYDPKVGTVYQANRSYRFKNGHRVKITVNSISSAELGDSLPPVFRLTNLVAIDRSYTPDPEQERKLNISVTAPGEEQDGIAAFGFQPPQESVGEVIVNWEYVEGEQYDLDWVFIDAESEFGAQLADAATYPRNMALLEPMFRNNFTRVTIDGHQYPISLVHQSQYLLVRVRTVSYQNGFRIEGQWAEEDYMVVTLADTWHEPQKNWQYNVTYAEDGKRKEVVSYADGTLRTRQMVTVANPGSTTSVGTSKYVVVQETLYDEFGRPVLSTLPAPMKDKMLKYYSGLHLNASGQPYNFNNFYGSGTACFNMPDPMYAPAAEPGKGAAGYYSPANPFRNDNNGFNNNDHIPDAGGYPFTLTRFTPDNTGRVAIQGGVGQVFQPGGGRATQYFYGKPNQWELDRIFGNDVGFADHYLKKMVVGPDGQVSFSYENASGRVIATALAGEAPANLQALENIVPASTPVQVILSPSQFRYDATKHLLTAQANYMAVLPNQQVKINVKMDQLMYRFWAQDGNTNICSNCYYSLRATISDDCGTITEVLNSSIGSKIEDCDLGSLVENEILFTPSKIGTYYIRFELGMSEDVIASYTENFIRSNPDLRTNLDFIVEQLNKVNFTDCISDCSSCLQTLGEKTAFVAHVKEQLELQNVTVTPHEAIIDAWASNMYDQLLAHCNAIRQDCNPSPCEEIRMEMLGDVSPGGQYALFDDRYGAVEVNINVISRFWRQVFPEKPATDPAYIRYQFETEAGVTSPHDTAFTLQMLVQYWNPEWADKFLQYHPEYCALQACDANAVYINWDNKLKNDILTAAQIPDIQSGLQYNAAQADWLTAADPYFMAGGPGELKRNEFNNRLLNYTQAISAGNTVKGLSQYVSFLLYCADPSSQANTATGANKWDNCTPAENCRVPDREWALYRDLYLALKQEYYQAQQGAACEGFCKPGAPISATRDNCPPASYFSAYEDGLLPDGVNKRMRLKFDGTASYSEIKVYMEYPEGYGTSSPHIFTYIPTANQYITVPKDMPVDKVRFIKTECTPLTGSAMNCSSLSLSSVGKQLNQYLFSDQVGWDNVNYHIVSGYADEEPDLDVYCAGAQADYYKCVELSISGKEGVYKYYNVWIVTCVTSQACANPVVYNMELQTGPNTFYGGGKYYSFNTQPSCSGAVDTVECATVNVAGQAQPIYYSGSSSNPITVFTCNECGPNVNSFTATATIGPDEYRIGMIRVLVVPNVEPTANIPPTGCYSYSKDWYDCITVAHDGTTTVYKNALLYQCVLGQESCVPERIITGVVKLSTDPLLYRSPTGYQENLYHFGTEVCDEAGGFMPAVPTHYDCLSFTGDFGTETFQDVTLYECFKQHPDPDEDPLSGPSGEIVAPFAFVDSAYTDYVDSRRYMVLKGQSADMPARRDGYENWTFLDWYSIRVAENDYRNFRKVWVAGEKRHIIKNVTAPRKTAATALQSGQMTEWSDECVFDASHFNIETIHYTDVGIDMYYHRVTFIGPGEIPAGKVLKVTVTTNYVPGSYPETDIIEIPADQASSTYNGMTHALQAEIASVEVTTECTGEGADPCLLYANKIPRFQIIAAPVLPPADLATLTNDAQNVILQQIQSNCEVNAEAWVRQLEDCLQDYPDFESKRQALKNGFIAVCKAGGDPSHILGSSTIPPDTSLPGNYTSFGDVILSVIGAQAYTMKCNPWRIEGAPYPYKAKVQGTYTTISSLTPEICTKLATLQTEYTGSGSTGTFYQFLKGKFGDGMQVTSAELDMLLKGCTNCRYLLEKDMVLPVFLEAGVKGCITAAEYSTAKTALQSAFGSNLDVNHSDYENIFATYMNHQWGFSMGYAQYMAYEEKLLLEPSAALCNQPAFGVTPEDPQSCLMGLVTDAVMRGNYLYAKYIEDEKRHFREQYLQICGSTRGTVTMEAPEKIYHYTLYYYNQAGQLIRTVPPEGVVPLSDEDVLKVSQARTRVEDNSDCSYPGPSEEGSKEVVNSEINRLMANTGALEYWFKQSGGTIQALHTTAISGEGYLVNMCLNGNFLNMDVYRIIPQQGRVDIVASRHTRVNISSALPLTDWTNVIVQGDINLFENGLKVFVNGNLCPAEAGATPSACGWQIGFENGQPVFPENYAAIRHIRTYGVRLTAQQAMMIAGNPCLDYDLDWNEESYPVTWNAFNWIPDDVPGEEDGTTPEPVYPDHKMVTSYAYNTLGQVTQQKTPDAGISKFWYDYLGRLILSQNAEQLAPVKPTDPADRLTYTQYDPFSRVEEVGELLDHGEIANKPFLNEAEYEVVFMGASKRQVTVTIYDHAPDWLPAGITLDNLRKRVSGSSFSEDGVTIDQKTYYSYDQIGNVKTLWQAIKGLNEAKRIDYDYDLASGKVNRVRYQGPGKNDRFMYGFEYDAENRLVTVENIASPLSDGWELGEAQTQAKYYYYPHGPLSRMELGESGFQGVDYAYTLQGWLKGVNGNFLETDKDMGRDGDANGRPTFAKDVFAYSLNYYNGDYTPLNTSANRFALQFTPSGGDGKGLYSGNIYGMTVAMDFFRNKAPVGYTYAYDQLNRLKQMRQQEITTSWTPGSSMAYAENISYDGNGNILQYQRNGSGVSPKPLGMDQLSYTYATINGEKSNRLASVTDSELATDYEQDIEGSREYTYDKIGNLVSEVYTDNGSQKEDKIYWNVYGKIRKVELGGGGSLDYGYDVAGNRVYKIFTKPDNSTVTTWYVRDAQGNALGTYKREGSQAVIWTEQQLYGSSRLGYWVPDMDVSVDDVNNRWESEGNKRYELTNHLGNVMAVLNGTKTGTTAEVLSMQDYYPFGSAMPGRYGKKLENGQVSLDVEGSDYRYGFNGKENDNEVKGEGNQQDYGMRIYDPRIGKFLSVDPIASKYPYYSPYHFAGNTPIMSIDIDGLEPSTSRAQWQFIEKKDGQYIYKTSDKDKIYFVAEKRNYDAHGNSYFQYTDPETNKWAGNFTPTGYEEQGPGGFPSEEVRASQNSNQAYGKSWRAFQDAVKSQAGSIWFVEKPLTTLVVGAAGFIGGGGIVAAERLLINTEARVVANEAAATTTATAAKASIKLLPKAYNRFPRIATKFAEHGDDWTSAGIDAFYKRAISLADSKVGGDILGFTSKEGWVFRMNSSTGEFLTMRPNGEIATFFRRLSEPAKYWAEQVAKYGQ